MVLLLKTMFRVYLVVIDTIPKGSNSPMACQDFVKSDNLKETSNQISALVLQDCSMTENNSVISHVSIIENNIQNLSFPVNDSISKGSSLNIGSLVKFPRGRSKESGKSLQKKEQFKEKRGVIKNAFKKK